MSPMPTPEFTQKPLEVSGDKQAHLSAELSH